MNNENIVLSNEEKEYLKKLKYYCEETDIECLCENLAKTDIDDLDTDVLSDIMLENPESVQFFIKLFDKYSDLSKIEVLDHFKYEFMTFIKKPGWIVVSPNHTKEEIYLKTRENPKKCLDKIEELIKETKSPLQQRESELSALKAEAIRDTAELKEFESKEGQNIGEE